MDSVVLGAKASNQTTISVQAAQLKYQQIANLSTKPTLASQEHKSLHNSLFEISEVGCKAMGDFTLVSLWFLFVTFSSVRGISCDVQ